MDREGLNDNSVYIHTEDVYGEVVHSGAYFSTVRYSKNGSDFEVLMENEDFWFISEREHPEAWGEPE